MHPLRRTAVVLLAVTATVLVVSPGYASEGVQKAQRRLNGLGCNAGPADGHAGTWTRTAVIRFQAANHLAQTGRLSARTRTRMYGDAPVHCDRRPVPGGSSGRRIVISQRQNYVWLVRADGSVVAQGGIVDNPHYLRPGTYAAGSKCGRAAKIRNNTDASGRLRLHDFTRFAPCGIGFHQVPQYRSTLAQIHPDHLLGTNERESHGCIRVSRRMADRVWDFASIGTKVVVAAAG
jgi:lipoprotein-anchoring transpeptidase ErfK/SrfK